MDSPRVITAKTDGRRCAPPSVLFALCWIFATDTSCLHRSALAQSPGDQAFTHGERTPSNQQRTDSYRAYPLTHGEAGGVEPLLRELLSGQQGTIRIVVDSQANQILLQGPPAAQQVAAKLIRAADQPPANAKLPAAQSPTRDQGLLVTYRVSPGSTGEVAAQLLKRYAGTPQVRIAAAPQHNLLFVFATQKIQREIRSSLKLPESETSAGGERETPAASPLLAATTSSRPIRQLPSQPIWLMQAGAKRVARQLRDLLGEPLQKLSSTGERNPGYVWRTSADGRVTIHFDTDRQTATVIGPATQARQMTRLLSTLDHVPSATGSLKVLSVRSEATGLINQGPERSRRYPPADEGSSQDSTTAILPPLNQSPFARSLFEPETEVDTDQRAQVADYQAQQGDSSLVMAQFEEEAGPDETGGVETNLDAATEDETADSEQTTPGRLLRQLGLDVDIEVLPDLDVIILRGRDDEVERVADIIREIEQIADESEAQIEIIPLQHTRSGALATLIQSTSTTLLKGRQGRATVISLDTPNALLLIGWGEANGTVRELIGKLDTPVAPDAQMQFFRLRHANANQVQRSIQQFFSSRTGLGPKVNAIADLRSNSLVVHATPRDMQAVAKLIEQLDVAEAATSEQVRIFKLSHTLASDLASTITAAVTSVRGTASSKSANLELLAVDAEGERIIKSGILDHVSIIPNTQTNTLVVTAPAESMDLVDALIGQLDQPTSTAQIKVFRIINGDANSMVIMLRSLLPTQTGNTTRPQLAGSAEETSLAPLRFSVERRTNSIIASGSTGDLRIVEALLMRLDENELKRRRNTVYRLKNAPATDVARAINEFLINQQRIQRLAPGELSPYQLIESEVVVVPEPVSNTLIISATTRFYEDIMELIEKLDAQPPQVMIQVLIAEVGLGDVDEFGVELGLQDSILFDRSLLGDLVTTVNSVSGSTPAGIITDTNEIIQGATNLPGFLFNSIGDLGNSGSDRSLSGSSKVGSQGVSNFAVGRINDDLGFGGLVLSASSESVSILIRALQESRRLEVLSRPQIMTLDNQSAFVQVGQRVPYITESQLTNFGRVNQVTLLDVGLIMGVTPRISPEGMVVMEIDAEKSLVGPVDEGIPIAISPGGETIKSPKIDITTAQTTVSAASGETIILGGLITKRTKNIHRRVPLLADIPLLGDLFRYDLVDTRRTELLIILTPHVILGPEDQERLKQVESARMSWCAADVNSLLGNGIYEEAGFPDQHSRVPIIYPDQNPRGLLEPSEPILPGPDIAPNDMPSDQPVPPAGDLLLPADDAATYPPNRLPSEVTIVPTQWQAGSKPQSDTPADPKKADAASTPETSTAVKKRWNPLGWLRK
jgi:type II secretion system protein D